jgi:hypothetical protein
MIGTTLRINRMISAFRTELIMTGNEKGWIVTISASLSALSIAASIVYGGLQWSSEANAREAEIEIRASSEFIRLMEFAHGRSSYILSSDCVKVVSEKMAKVERLDPNNVNRMIEDSCVINMPVAAGSQKAAMQLMASFGKKFPFLFEPAKESLSNMVEKNIAKDSAQAALARLEAQ